MKLMFFFNYILIKGVPIILVFSLFFMSCVSKEDTRIIAIFNEEELFLSDVISQMPNQTQDSAYFVQRFINDWIRKRLMISHAEINLRTDLLQYEKQIEDYRESLLIYAYQQELLHQNFDTMISFAEIEDYYNEYQDELRLAKNIFQGRFIVVDKLAPKLKSLDRWYKSEKETDSNALDDYCKQFAKEYHLDGAKWEQFSIFNNKLPNPIKEEEYFLRNTKGVFFEDENFKYYIFIKDYKIKGAISPLVVERHKIKDVLLNKKKIEYLKQIENNLYEKALAKKKIKIYK